LPALGTVPTFTRACAPLLGGVRRSWRRAIEFDGARY